MPSGFGKSNNVLVDDGRVIIFLIGWLSFLEVTSFITFNSFTGIRCLWNPEPDVTSSYSAFQWGLYLCKYNVLFGSSES